MKNSPIPLYGPAKVGGDTLAFCTRCKLELSHVIVAMFEGKPVRVLCKTCKTERKYRVSTAKRETTAPRAAATRSPTASSRTASRAEVLWELKMKEAAGKVPHPYSPRDSFNVGDVVQHSKFGLGVVEEVKTGGKILALFRDGSRVLVHTQASAS